MSKTDITSARLMERDRMTVASTIYRYTDIAFERGEGVYLYDFEGRRYLDFVAGIATMSVGHCHPAVVEAICDQAKKLIHGACHVGYMAPYVELVEKVKSIAPGALQDGKAILVNSGGEAVETALKLARYVTGRPMVVAFHGNFHGRPMGALACTASNPLYRRRLSALLGGVYHSPFPYCFRCPLGHKSPDDCGLACLNLLEYAFKTVLPPEDLAAILVEPIAGEGGYVVPPAGFLEGLRQICDRYEAMLLVDEIQTGFARTGKMFAIEHWPQAEADALILGKAIGGGVPLAAVLAKTKWMDKWPPAAHGTTFGGNPVACRAGATSIQIILDQDLMGNAARVGEHVQQRFRQAQEELPVIGQVRGKGLMVGVELVDAQGGQAVEISKEVLKLASRAGLVLTKCGPNTIRIAPPLVLTEEQADEGVDIILEALRKLQW